MTKWVPGQSGNPKGRPLRGRSVAELARLIAQEKVGFPDGDGTITCTRLERLIRVLWTMSLEGDLRAMRCLLEYMEGRPAQVVAATIEVSEAPGFSEAEKAEMAQLMEKRLAEWRSEAAGRPGANQAGANEAGGEAGSDDAQSG